VVGARHDARLRRLVEPVTVESIAAWSRASRMRWRIAVMTPTRAACSPAYSLSELPS
jgi:hypothetical protein